MSEHVVRLLSKPDIDLNTFLINSHHALGRSISDSLDRRRIKVDKDSSFLVLLGEMKQQNINPQELMRNPGDLLRHLFYSFIVATTKQTIFELFEVTTLSVCNTKTIKKGIILAVVSGNLEQWRDGIINATSIHVSENLRSLFNLFLINFDKLGFSDLWAQYTRYSQPDKTFALIAK